MSVVTPKATLLFGADRCWLLSTLHAKTSRLGNSNVCKALRTRGSGRTIRGGLTLTPSEPRKVLDHTDQGLRKIYNAPQRASGCCSAGPEISCESALVASSASNFRKRRP